MSDTRWVTTADGRSLAIAIGDRVWYRPPRSRGGRAFLARVHNHTAQRVGVVLLRGLDGGEIDPIYTMVDPKNLAVYVE